MDQVPIGHRFEPQPTRYLYQYNLFFWSVLDISVLRKGQKPKKGLSVNCEFEEFCNERESYD